MENLHKGLYKFRKWGRIFSSIIGILICLVIISAVYKSYFTPLDDKNKESENKKTGALFIFFFVVFLLILLIRVYKDYFVTFTEYKKNGYGSMWTTTTTWNI